MIVSEVVRLVEAMDMESQVLISSFKFDYLNAGQRTQPEPGDRRLVSNYQMDPLSLMQTLDAQAYHPGLKATRTSGAIAA